MKANSYAFARGMLSNFDAKSFGKGMQMRDSHNWEPHKSSERASICEHRFTENMHSQSPHARRLVQALVCICGTECVQI